eukprot:PRCOL_00006984-RA
MANLVMSSSTAFMLALGRFAFKDFKDASLANAGLPTQNGETHAEAGDARAAEATFITATNDPAGFNIIDVLAWGSLGHVLGIATLATQSNTYGIF